MKYTRIKVALGNKSDLVNCACNCPIGYEFDINHPFTDINKAYQFAASYNKGKCGCRCEVKEIE